MTPRKPREAAVAWVKRALLAELPNEPWDHLDDFCESLVALAEQFEIPDDRLIFWIHDQPTGKDWSLASWRAWCERYAQSAAQLPAEATDSEQRTPQAQEPEKESGYGICTRCFSQVAQKIGENRWWCAKCGEVQP